MSPLPPEKSQSLNHFVTRYAVRETFKNEKGETENAIYLTEDKTVCTEGEQFRFYAKIGGHLNMQDLNTQKVKELIEKVDMANGFYLVMTNYRTIKGPKNYATVYPHINTKVLDIPINPLVSFFPRIDGHTGEVICGLRILGADEKSTRDWTRFVGSPKAKPNGFSELKFGYNFDDDYNKRPKTKFAGFYVNKNTSLIVFDIGTIDPTKEIVPEQNRTLIQEGGFVYADVDLLFRLCSETEDKLYSAKELYEKFKDADNSVLGSDKYKRAHLIRDKKEPKMRSVIFFLKSTPFLLPYELHITDDISKESLFKGKRIAILTIPSGAEFEYCDFWSLRDGLQVVQKRQKAEPWKKYLQKTTEVTEDWATKMEDIPFMSYPEDASHEKTPQNEELSKKIKKIRKKVFGNSNSKSNSNKNKKPKEVKPTPENKPEESEKTEDPNKPKPGPEVPNKPQPGTEDPNKPKPGPEVPNKPQPGTEDQKPKE